MNSFKELAELKKKYPLPKITIDKDGKETKTIPAVIFERDELIKRIEALEKSVEKIEKKLK